MSLFADFGIPDPDPSERGRPRRRRRSYAWIGWTLLVGAIAGLTAAAVLPAPYVFYVPGPVIDTLGEVRFDGAQVPMIEIEGATTYPTAGTLDLLTVQTLGSPDRLPNWLEVAGAWFDPRRTVLPVDLVFPPGYSVEEAGESGRIEMRNSQQEAIAAALSELGYEFDSDLRIAGITEGGASDGILQEGDIIVSFNGVDHPDVTGLRAGIAENGTETPATIVVNRNGRELTLEVTPRMSDTDQPVPVVGILVGGEYRFPIDVTIQLENVGGPSAGLMFALGIVDKLTPGELNGGANVAGTGTISGTGLVGAIGGVQQKLWGARDAGADWFLVPAGNCAEMPGNIPPGLTVVSVTSLDDALAALEVIAAGGDAAGLPNCGAGG